MHIWLCCLFFYAVPIALRKKKHGYETKKEKDFFIPTTWFIVTDPANSFINHVNAFKLCTNALGKYENRTALDTSTAP